MILKMVLLFNVDLIMQVFSVDVEEDNIFQHKDFCFFLILVDDCVIMIR